MRVGRRIDTPPRTTARVRDIALRQPIHYPPGARVGYNTSIIPERDGARDSRARLYMRASRFCGA